MKQPIFLICNDCGTTFDLLNSYWKRPLASCKWLHNSAMGCEHFTVWNADGSTNKTVQRSPNKTLSGNRFSMVGL